MQQLNRAPELSTVQRPSLTVVPSAPFVVDQSTRKPAFQTPTASPWSVSSSKRLLDFSGALLGLTVFAMPMAIIALLVQMTSNGPALFVQNRVGREGRIFSIYKFRSMAMASSGKVGPGLTKDGDLRITNVGRVLRKLKLDELPQLINILRGDMSFVGPRPKLPQYAAIANMPYRPGITGAATLAFRREEEILGRVHPTQLDAFYHQRIKPLKARLDVRYMCRATFMTDMRLIAATFLACVAPARVPVAFRDASTRVVAFQVKPGPEARADRPFEAAT